MPQTIKNGKSGDTKVRSADVMLRLLMECSAVDLTGVSPVNFIQITLVSSTTLATFEIGLART